MKNKLLREKILQWITHAIEEANAEELQSIILAVCKAMERKDPSSEAVFLTLPCNDTEERRQILDRFHEMMLHHHK